MAVEKQSAQWFESLLFPEIFKTFRMAIQPSKLIIAFLTISVICISGWLMDFSRTVVATPDTQSRVTELDTYLANPDRLDSYIEVFSQTGDRTGVFTTLWHLISQRYHHALRALFDFNLTDVAQDGEVCFMALGWALQHHLIYCIIFCIIGHAVFSIAGGAICRIAALQFAQGEKPGLTEAIRFGFRKFPSFFAAPLVPISTILFAGLFIVLIGLAGNIPKAGEMIVGLLLPIVLLAGAFIAFVSIGAIAGFNLMSPSIAYDGLDCYDAISRTFNYVYVRPWRMGFYTAIGAVYGSVCYLFVRLFAFLLILVARCFLEIGIWVENEAGAGKLAALWPKPHLGSLLGSRITTPVSWSENAAAAIIYLFLLVVVGTVVSFIVSFYFSANTIIYALMRHRVDETTLDIVCRHSEDMLAETVPTQPGFNKTQTSQDSPRYEE